MASSRGEYKEYIKFKVLQLINEDPQLTSRELAKKVRISNGSAYYLLISLINNGYVELSNFKESSKKLKYTYLLTPKGVREKSLNTVKFLNRKKHEFELLQKEIAELEKSIGLDIELKKKS